MERSLNPSSICWKKRTLAIGLILLIAVIFWSGSRYPSLSGKAVLGPQGEIFTVAFNSRYNLVEKTTNWHVAFYGFLNWCLDNREGMIFGVVFAAAAMCLLSQFHRKTTGTRIGDSTLGLVAGTPLGVCVNCAAPVAKGLSKGGAKPEIAIATMLSSPTTNIIVVSMTFALLPWHMAALKLALSILFVVIATPLIVKFAIPKQNELSESSCELESSIQPESTKWQESWLWLVTSFAKNLWYIVVRAVPLMLVAGLLGAILVAWVPWKEFVDLSVHGGIQLLIIFAVLALIGAFLPMPIALDVVIVVGLLASGMEPHLAMVLLFTLGIYSIYAQLIVTNTWQWRAGALLYVGVVVTGIGAGVLSYYIGSWQYKKDQEYITQTLEQLPQKSDPAEALPHTPPIDTSVLQQLLESNRKEWEEEDLVKSYHLAEKTESDFSVFRRMNGEEFGVDLPWSFSLGRLTWGGVTFHRPIASGDLHNDGWPDLLIANDIDAGGFTLFANIAGQRFQAQRIALGNHQDEKITSLAAVDINNDGWLDIVYSTLTDGSWLVLNQEGDFTTATPALIHERHPFHVNAAGFADLDSDGNIEVALGYMADDMSSTRQVGAGNIIAWQSAEGEFTIEDLPAEPGYTHSIAISDFDGDRHPDIVVGNDYGIADVAYQNDGLGGLTQVLPDDNVFPWFPLSTMSIFPADLDNDLEPEWFLAQVSKGSNVVQFNRNYSVRVELLPQYLESPMELATQEKMLEYGTLVQLGHHGRFADALRLFPEGSPDRYEAVEVVSAAILRSHRVKWADSITSVDDRSPQFQNLIEVLTSERAKAPSAETIAKRHRQIWRTNVLHRRSPPDLAFTDEASARGIGATGWTWNATFADADNDGDVDLYTANGMMASRYRDNNLFFENDGTGHFREMTSPFGLDDYLVTNSFVWVDFDRDGDLDIVSVPSNGPVRFFMNEESARNAVTISLRDRQGNHFGIGARITLETAMGKQMREILASGGFQSFSPLEAHFGLGEDSEIFSIEILWRDGETTTLEGPFEANKHYQIHRSEK